MNKGEAMGRRIEPLKVWRCKGCGAQRWRPAEYHWHRDTEEYVPAEAIEVMPVADHLDALGEAKAAMDRVVESHRKWREQEEQRAVAAEEALAGLREGLRKEIERLHGWAYVPVGEKRIDNVYLRLQALLDDSQEDSKKPELSAEEGAA